MASSSRSRKWFSCVVVGLLCGPLHARVLELGIERITTPLGPIDGIAVQLDWPDAAASGELRLTAEALDASELGYRYRKLRWRCSVQRVDPEGFRCEGKVSAQGAGSATLAAQWKDGSVDLSLRDGKGEFAAALPAGAAPTVLRGVRLPVTWLQPMLARHWSEGRLTAGTLDAEVTISSIAGGDTEIAGPLTATALGLDSVDGRIATAALDAQGRFGLVLESGGTSLDADLTLQGGELLLGPMYAALPESPVEARISLASSAAGHWAIERLSWSDEGVLMFSGDGAIETGAEPWLRDFKGLLTLSDLERAHPRYLDTLLGTLGLAKLQIDGRVRTQLTLREGRPANLQVDFDAVNARDGAQRFAFEDLGGTLHWTASEAPVESALHWQSAQLYEIDIGAAAVPLSSAQRGLSLRGATTLPVLDGHLVLPRFSWRPAGDAQANTALDLAMDLTDIDLAKLSRALGWPNFPGTLSGRIPGVRYADEVLSFDGGLTMAMFDGRVEIAALTLERPFGVAPSLTADVAFANLDLQPLTGAFGFGEITGRLDGHVRELRLVDWSPVAFDADLHTSTRVKGPRRISQRAVNDLTRVGGGGLVAGLQGQMLKVFETFGYERIGLKCRLANNVCQMDGLDSSGRGYTIVQGSGLPRITVIGHQRQVDWPVLVARLKAATEGQTPLIQ